MKNESKQYWDIIGDIHGELDALRRLLAKLGYGDSGGSFIPPEGRKAIFVGDFIDRGPDSLGVLELVREMVSSGAALAVMGNHEFNLVSYMTPDGKGGYLKPHHGNYPSQIEATLASFAGKDDKLHDYVAWMRSLPLFLELEELRVVHASWIPEDIDYLRDKSLADDEFLREANRKGSRSHRAIEHVLKGLETTMPDGMSIVDSNGIDRRSMRIRWWGEMEGATWIDVAFPPVSGLPDSRIDSHAAVEWVGYDTSEPPVFFGHYKLKEMDPFLPAKNLACLDYGLGHGGAASAYRWSGESQLAIENMVQVPEREKLRYRLIIADNFHYMENEEDDAGGSASYEAVLERAMKIVDDYLERVFTPGMSAADLYDHYTSFADDPYIQPTPPGVERFSAWEYADCRSQEIASDTACVG